MIHIVLAQAPPSVQVGMVIWVPVISALLASALTGVISYFLVACRIRHEERVEKRRFLIGKLEETHQVTRSLLRFSCAHYAQLSTITMAPNAPELTRQLQSSTQHDADMPIDHLCMLVEFYFLDLHPQLRLVRSAQEEYGRVLTEIVQLLPTADSITRRSVWERLQVAHAEIQKAFRALQDGLSTVARGLLQHGAHNRWVQPSTTKQR